MTTRILRGLLATAQARVDATLERVHAAPTVLAWQCACAELRIAWRVRDEIADDLAAAMAAEDTALETGGYWPQGVRHA